MQPYGIAAYNIIHHDNPENAIIKVVTQLNGFTCDWISLARVEPTPIK